MTQANFESSFVFDEKNQSYRCSGAWSILYIDDLLERFKKTIPTGKATICFNGADISQFDSAGALAVLECVAALKQGGNEVKLVEFSKEQHSLIKLVTEHQANLDYQPSEKPQAHILERIGKESIYKLQQADGFIILLGNLSVKLFEAFGYWKRFQLPSIISNIASAGIQALPILALLSFLIGVVLAYQMGVQLETYGANVFIAYISGMSIFREFAPLITAIIVAGRTSSAFTAQIGSMEINEEIDAIKTMGLSPVELLVLPKMLGLLIVFPLLVFWSAVFSILGSLVMSQWMLNVSYLDFMLRLKDSVGFHQLVLGLYKAPAFAIVIALVGCFQGFRVRADTMGSQTTRSVVQSLFLIIVVDSIYSVIYSWLGL